MKFVGILCMALLTLSLSFSPANAQFKRSREYSGFFDTYYFRGPITFTLGAGISAYKGDLSSGIDFGSMGYGVSIGANYKVWPRIAFGGEFSYYTLNGKDHIAERNISFTSTNYELYGYGRFYIIDETVRLSKDRVKERSLTLIKPYVMSGIGLTMFSPKSTNNGSLSDAALGGPEATSYSTITPIIPLGLGFQFQPSFRWSFVLEGAYRFTFTDYLDDVSARGNDGKKDGYGFVTFKIQFAPSAPKKSKQAKLSAPKPYDGPKGTETWKTRKKKEPAPANNNDYAPVEEVVPTDEEQPAEEQPVEEQPIEEQPVEETPADNNGWGQ
jgi:hypothetical protein